MSDEIIIALIGGFFAILGALIQAKKCCFSDSNTNNIERGRFDLEAQNINTYLINNSRPLQVLNEIYEVPKGTVTVNESNYVSIIDDYKYKIDVEPKLNLGQPDTVNIFHVKRHNYSNCNFTVKLSNVNGEVYLFIKRFDNLWKFAGPEPTKKILGVNGINCLSFSSMIGQHNIVVEQIGVMVYSSKGNVNASCIIEEVKLNNF
tara:strand:- start:11529 stop:12140 length:612 start_codon:yes stop_codon:yes gene_type:complete